MPFTVPDIAIASHPGLISSPRDLNGWIRELPMGNPPRAAQMLLQQLQLLIRDPDPGARFNALLELYSEPVGRLLEVVNERFNDNFDLALPVDQLESAMIDLLTELAYGQLRLANECLVGGKPTRSEWLYSALERMDTAALIEHLHYRQRDPARWQQMLTVFLHAEQQGLHDQPIPSPPSRSGEPDTIRGLFFRRLVIGLCDPYVHHPGNVLSWYRWLGRHTGQLQLSVLPQGGYSIPVDASGELEPLAGARRGKPGANMRYLLMEEFLQQLHDDGDAPPGLFAALDALIKGRKASDQRGSPRQDREHPFRLLHGLRNVHERLLQLGSGQASEAPLQTPIDARQINQSKTGAAFFVHGPIRPPLAIGDTLLAEADNPRPGGGPIGFVARVRRVVSNDGGTTELGVEKLQGRVVPVQLSGSAAERARGDIHALLQQLPESGTYGLMAASSVFRSNDSVTVAGANVQMNLRMLRLRPLTRRFGYIEVEPVD